MIEKIMKAVKSSNKRRGRNITIGAVIGFLLSCTAVMGADDNYLFIKDNDGIKFSTDNSEPALTANPYAENNWLESTETYINNTILSADGTGVEAYGVKLGLKSPNFRFINNGAINTSSDSKNAYGIYLDNGKVESIENNGVITGDSVTGLSAGIGIYDGGSAIQIINNGIINNIIGPNAADTKSGMGIIIASSSEGAEKIINIGEINSSNGGNAYAYGIRVGKETREVVNVGNIKTFNAKGSYGIGSYNFNNSAKINNLLNMGTISSFDSSNENYGIYSDNN